MLTPTSAITQPLPARQVQPVPRPQTTANAGYFTWAAEVLAVAPAKQVTTASVGATSDARAATVSLRALPAYSARYGWVRPLSGGISVNAPVGNYSQPDGRFGLVGFDQGGDARSFTDAVLAASDAARAGDTLGPQPGAAHGVLQAADGRYFITLLGTVENGLPNYATLDQLATAQVKTIDLKAAVDANGFIDLRTAASPG